MLLRRFEAVLTVLLTWLTALSFALAGPAFSQPTPTPRVHDQDADAARASLQLGLAGLGVTALYCLFPGRIHKRDPRDDAAWPPTILEPQPDGDAPLIDAKARGRRGVPEVDR